MVFRGLGFHRSGAIDGRNQTSKCITVTEEHSHSEDQHYLYEKQASKNRAVFVLASMLRPPQH
jgi:hypothetical protein